MSLFSLPVVSLHGISKISSGANAGLANFIIATIDSCKMMKELEEEVENSRTQKYSE